MPETKMIHDLEVDAFLHECVTVEPLALQEEFVRLPADLAYWNERVAQANRAYLTSKMDTDRLRARLRIEKRELLAADATKKAPTESMVDAAVEDDAEWQDQRITMIDAEVELERLKGVARAVAAKKDVLQSIGAQLRIEMQHDPIVRRQMTESGY